MCIDLPSSGVTQAGTGRGGSVLGVCNGGRGGHDTVGVIACGGP